MRKASLPSVGVSSQHASREGRASGGSHGSVVWPSPVRSRGQEPGLKSGLRDECKGFSSRSCLLQLTECHPIVAMIEMYHGTEARDRRQRASH